MTCLQLFATAVLTLGLVGADLRRVCYHTNWAQYRNGPAKFFPENVDPNLCTNIIYSFAKMAGNHLVAYEWNDESTAWMKGMYERFTDIKTANPSVKLSLAVGGWNMASAPFTSMVATASSRMEFATSTIKFLRDHKFDGIDMDWEYPGNRGSPAGDKQRYVQLLQTMRAEFHKEAASTGNEELLISAAVPAGKPNIDAGYDVPAVSKELDFINLMTYDLHGSWESFTGHNAPLHARAAETGNQTNLNVEWASKYWVSLGAPKSKMNIGVPLYGRTFKISSGNDIIGCPASGAGPAGLYTSEAGFLSYYEVCAKLAGGATKHRDPEGKVPYFSDGTMWCGYDDPQSLAEKVAYIKNEGFGGVMVWALDLDDFSGSCGQGKYPLMQSIITELNNPASGGSGPVTSAPVTSAPVTAAPVTAAPITAAPVTAAPITAAPITAAPITAAPITAAPVTAAPITSGPIVVTSKPSNGNHHDLSLVSLSEFDCNSKADGYYPSPTSCSNYYICANRMAFMTDCHPGLMFNAATLYCDFPDHVTCSLSATASVTSAPMPGAPITAAPVTAAPVTAAPVTAAPVTATPVTSAPAGPAILTTTKAPPTTPTKAPVEASTRAPVVTTTTTALVNPVDFCKGKADGFYADPTDCSHFYQCWFEKANHETCPGGTSFSITLKGCDWTANVPNCP